MPFLPRGAELAGMIAQERNTATLRDEVGKLYDSAGKRNHVVAVGVERIQNPDLDESPNA